MKWLWALAVTGRQRTNSLWSGIQSLIFSGELRGPSTESRSTSGTFVAGQGSWR